MFGFDIPKLLHLLGELIVILPLLLVSIIAHEYAHGWAAYKFGDDTAKRLGRLSINPIRHMDPLGTLMLVITPFMGFIFGWAKPVPVNFFALDRYPFSMAMVALAGPATNLLFMLLGMGLLKVGVLLSFPDMVMAGIDLFMFLNLILLLLNLLPIPPLDGSKVVYSLLPRRQVYALMRYEIYGLGFMLIVMILFNDYIFKFLDGIHRWLLNLL